MNYARELPLDKLSNRVDFAPPAQIANQSQIGQPAVSSVITLSDKTTIIEMSVIGGQSANSAIIGKWGSSSVTSSNFDFVVQSGATRMLVPPVSVAGISSVAGANVANGLYAFVSVKNATATLASVLTVEY